MTIYWKIIPSDNVIPVGIYWQIPANLEKVLINKIPELKYTGKVLLNNKYLNDLYVYRRDYSCGSDIFVKAIDKIISSIKVCGEVELCVTKNLEGI